MSTVFYRCFHSVMAPPVCRNTPRLCAALLLPESCRVFQWNRKRAFASAPVKIRYICREPFVQPFTPPAVSTISVLHPLQQFPCKNRCIWRKRRHLLLPCRQICCLDEDLGVERLLYRAQNRFVFCDCRNEVVVFTMHKGYQPVESLLELLRSSAPESAERGGRRTYNNSGRA